MTPPKKAAKPFTCKECGLHYSEKEWAEKCQKWCRSHHSCNLAITRHAMRNKPKEMKQT